MEIPQTIVTIAPPTSSNNSANNNNSGGRSARVKPSLPKFCHLGRSSSLNEEGTAASAQLRVGGGGGGKRGKRSSNAVGADRMAGDRKISG